jgi:hypothetical protein
LQKSLQSQPKEKLVLKYFQPLKNKKRYSQHNTTKTVKLNNDNGLQTRWTETPAANSVLPQLAVTCKIVAECYYQTFVQVDSEVLRNRQLRQHANRYVPPEPRFRHCTVDNKHSC